MLETPNSVQKKISDLIWYREILTEFSRRLSGSVDRRVLVFVCAAHLRMWRWV
jgi:hypothetical protein